jgi:hypothetical protein
MPTVSFLRKAARILSAAPLWAISRFPDPAAAISRLLANPAALASAAASARKLVAIDTEAVALAVLAPAHGVGCAAQK